MSERVEELLDQLVRLEALQIRRGMESQAEAIDAFLSVGLEPPRIAELLDTTAGTVRAAKARKKGSKGRK